MSDVYILSAVRTAIGRFQGTLSGLPAAELGGVVLKEALSRSGASAEDVDEVILGHVLQGGAGQAPARQSARRAELPDRIPALTINKVCGSGLKAVCLAAQAIKAGDADLLLAGGQESMSQAPYYLPDARTGIRLGHGRVLDGMIYDGLWDPYDDQHMGMTAELVVREFGISREDQDAYAARSHERALKAQEKSLFDREIVPVKVPQRKGDPLLFARDEGPREGVTAESLGRLKPAFDREGSVTAGNASTINDGASALVVASARKVEELGVQPLAKITAYASGFVEPRWVMMAPLEGVKKVEERLSVSAASFDLVEINEAFSASTVALIRKLGLDQDRVNIHGGAVALGHPIGCSGARILTTLLHALKHRGGETGLATLCLGGGGSVAVAVETC
ncbi:MAG: acetyl-CoA C-acetyltransferase [Planctomycetota bacterium]|jgi:acetyl-CoA C-acetyltransferase|nr:acetyl-CoA C-acetyltransferase [Planctomycetota bacterium]